MSKINSALFSSNSDEWATPNNVFEDLNTEFHFTLDPCATAQNAKCQFFYTTEDNGLLLDWEGQSCFVNPPYSQIKAWVKKCYEESQKPHTKVVMLIPARTDTHYFHDFILGKAELRFVRGRLHFNDSKNSAPFPSMIVIFN